MIFRNSEFLLDYSRPFKVEDWNVDYVLVTCRIFYSSCSIIRLCSGQMKRDYMVLCYCGCILKQKWEREGTKKTAEGFDIFDTTSRAGVIGFEFGFIDVFSVLGPGGFC